MARIPALLLALTSSLAVLAAPAASADPTVLATTTAATSLSAHGGWLVWSAPAGGGWKLMTSHGGAVRAAPIAPRPQPFDADVGTDAGGRPAVTFSRCAQTPTDLWPGAGVTASWTGRGCTVRVLDLGSGRERSAGIPRARGDSDTTPSMWRGRIAFARREPGHGDVAQVRLFTPRGRHVTPLPHGAVPTDCPYRGGCAREVVRGGVADLDLGADLLAFRWWVDAPGVVGGGGWEIRVDRLRDRSTMLLGSGFVGEACTGGPDSETPGAPSIAGSRVWWLESWTQCEQYHANLQGHDAAPGPLLSGPLPPTVIALADDGGTLYGLLAPVPPAQPGVSMPADLTCAAPDAPCQVVRLDTPALSPQDGRAREPFF